MGIFGALTTAVTGLRAQSFALENISGNIANSQTTAFKRVDTSFMDLIPDNPPSKQLAGSVTARKSARAAGQSFQVMRRAFRARTSPLNIQTLTPMMP